MSKFKFVAAIAALAVMAGPALAGKKPTAGTSANPPGKQMQGTYAPSERGSHHGASGFVHQDPPGQATRLTTPGTSATTRGKMKN